MGSPIPIRAGAPDGKAAYLQAVRSGKFAYRSIERPQEQIQVYGETAVVTGQARVDLVVSGEPRVANLRNTSVWVNGARGWRTVAVQAISILT